MYFIHGFYTQIPISSFQVDGAFVKSICGILRILVPSFFSKEGGYLFLVAITLIFRSVLDLWMIDNGTLIEG